MSAVSEMRKNDTVVRELLIPSKQSTKNSAVTKIEIKEVFSFNFHFLYYNIQRFGFWECCE